MFDFSKRIPIMSHKKPEIVGSSGWGRGTCWVEKEHRGICFTVYPLIAFEVLNPVSYQGPELG